MTSLMTAAELPQLSVPVKMLLGSSGRVWSQLDDFQRKAVAFVWERKTVALFFEQGTGKTWITAGVLGLLGPNQSSLVVVPKNNKETSWLELLHRCFPDYPIHTEWEEFKRGKYIGVLVMHYEQLRGRMINKLKRRLWDCIVYDESQRLKDRGSAASRQARMLRERAEFKVALSGTPLDGAPEDVWGQMRFVAPDCFGDKWEDFFEDHMRASGFMGYKKVFREETRPEFIRKLRKYAIRQDDSVLNLPDFHTKEVWVKMNEKQKVAYWDMRVLKQVRLTRKASVQAPLTITRDMCLSQIAGGFLQCDKDVYWLSYRKILAVQKILRENPKPTVIFCRFLPELEMLKTKLSRHYRVATYSGKTKNKPEVQRNFQAGEYDILICQIRAGGVGIDLFNGRTIILYSGNWSSIDFHQLRKRVHRRGQRFEVTFFLVMTKQTIDVKLRRRILAKSTDNDSTLKELTRHGKERKGRRQQGRDEEDVRGQ